MQRPESPAADSVPLENSLVDDTGIHRYLSKRTETHLQKYLYDAHNILLFKIAKNMSNKRQVTYSYHRLPLRILKKLLIT